MVICRAIEVLGVMAKTCDTISIEPVQAAAIGSGPDYPARIQGRMVSARAEAVGVIGVGEVVREGPPVPTMQACGRADP